MSTNHTPRWCSLTACFLLQCLAVIATPQALPAQESPEAGKSDPPAGLKYEQLADPELSAKLKLTDEQRAKIDELLKQRSEALQKAEAADKPKIIETSDGQLRAVLTEEQRRQLAGAAAEPKLRFNFRYQRWAEVLQWLAEQADLSLVMDAPPPATFNYTDAKEYTPTEAIDLLNGVLLTKDFTLIRRGRMLIVIDMSQGIPQDLIPRVNLTELDKRGKHEFVSVMFPLGKRNASEVDKEITPLLGSQGKSIPLPKTQQILVTATAGNMRAIGAVIESIPEPAPPKPAPTPPKPKPPEKPELRTYAAKTIDAAAAIEVLKQLVGGAKFVNDAKAEQINVYATPTQHTAITQFLDKMKAENPPDKRPQLELYQLDPGNHEELEGTLKLVAPGMELRIDAAANQLIAWGTPEEQAKIKSTLEKLGSGGSVDKTAQIEIYPLTKAEPGPTQDMLRNLVPKARISYDGQTRSLIVVAQADDQRVIKETLSQLQPEAPGPSTPQLQFYPFDAAIPAGLVEVLQQVVPRAQIRPGARGRKLVVTAIPEDHKLIAETIKKFDVADPGAKPTLEIYPVTSAQRKRFQAVLDSITGDLPGIRIITDAEPGELAVWARPTEHAALRDILEKLKREVPAEEKFTLEDYAVKADQQSQNVSLLQTIYPELRIIPDARGNRLLIWAAPDQHQQVKLTLDKLLSKGRPVAGPRFEAYPIAGADAASLLPTLQTLLPEMRISVDPQSSRLVAWGTPANHARLNAALEKLSGGTPQTTPQIEVYPLTKADPAAAQTLLQSLFPAAKLTIDPQTRSLVAIAIPADQQGIRATLEQLQPGQAGPNARKLQFIPLAGPPPESLIPVLNQLTPRAQVTYDPKDKRLMVVADADDHEVIRETVQRVVTSAVPIEKNKLKIYPVTPAQRTRFQSVLDSVQTELPGIRVITDAEPGELAIWAKPTQHAVLADIIEELKQKDSPGDKFVFVAYSLKNADASNTLTVMQSLFPGVKFVLEAKTKKLLVWAPPEQQARVKDAIDKIDTRVSPEMQESYRVYPIRDSDPNALIALLQQQVPDVKFTGDSTAQTIIAWGRYADHKVIAATLKQILEGRDKLRKAKVVIYHPGKSDAAAVMRGLRQLFPNARIDDDSSTNSIMVWATPAEHEEIAEVIEQITENANSQANAVMRIYTVPPAAASSTQQIAQLAVPQARVLLSGSPPRLVVWAKPEDHAQIADVVEQIENENDQQRNRELAIFDLDGVDSSAILSLLDPELRSETQFITSTDRKQLIVRANKGRLEALKTAIEQAREKLPKTEEPTSHVYSLKHTDPNSLIAVLQPITPGVPMVPNSRQRTLTITTTPDNHRKIQAAIDKIDVERIGENAPYMKSYQIKRSDPGTTYGVVSHVMSGNPDMQLSFDGRNGAIIAFARPEQHEKIAATIADIEKDIAGATTEVYRFRTADPNSAAGILRTLAPRAQITVDNRNRSLVVNAIDADHAKIKETIAKMDADANDNNGAVLKAYAIKLAEPGNLLSMLQTNFALQPDIRLSADYKNDTIVALATPAQHEKIAAFIAEVDKQGKVRTPEVYRFRSADPNAAAGILRPMIPKASIMLDNRNRSLVVSGTPEEHAIVKATVAKMDSDTNDNNGVVMRAYEIKSAEPGNLLSMLQTNFALQPDIRLSADYKNDTIVALATPAQHERIAAFIAEVDKKGKVRTPEVYRFSAADPNAAIGILRTLVPKAQMAVDNRNRSLVISATDEEHQTIKAAIEKMNSEQNADSGAMLRSYAIKFAEPNNLLGMLQNNFALQPDVRLSLDSRNDNIVALARPEQHDRIKAFIDEVEKNGQQRTTKVYRFRIADPNSAITVLQTLTPKAQMAVDRGSRSLVVTASEGDHERIAGTIKEMDREDADGTGPQLKSYPVEFAQVNTLAQAIQSAYRNRPDVQITYDSRNGTVAAVAPAAEHKKIEKFIKEADQQGAAVETRVYRFETADPQAAARVLRSLTPRAEIAVDNNSRALVVSGTDADHAKISATVKALDGGGDGSTAPRLKVYPLKSADGRSLQSTLRTLFRRYNDVEVNFDPDNESIVVLAPPKTQERIAEMVEEVEQASGTDPMAKLQVYRLKTSDARDALDVLESAFSTESPKIKFSFNRRGRQISAIARPEQHARIQQTLDQMDKDQRVLEVYQLEMTEPFSAELSIDRLFGGEDFDDPNAPIVDSDEATQQLFVRATREQQEQIRELLVKMGETGLAVRTANGKSRRMRVIPFRGDAAAAIREIQRVWPQLRKNDIKIVTPSAVAPSLRRLSPVGKPNQDNAPSDKPPAQFAVPAEDVPPTTDKKPQPKPAEQPPANPPAEKDQTNQPNRPPIVVAPGEGSITIASDDHEALDQLETLLRAMSSRRAGGRGKDFVIFSLRHTSALQAANTLREIFGIEGGRRRRSSFSSNSTGSVTIVPDERLNALIVHGNRNDRETIESLLQVLDAEDIPESLAANRPRLIPVKNTDAERIERVIRSIYKSALTTGGGAPPIPVPGGVSRNVAAAIQRVNAASNAPLLTIEVDERSNSLVVMAPATLMEEIEQLVEQMDQASTNDSSRRLKVIQLKKLNTRSLERSLDMLINERGRSRRRRNRNR